MAAVPNGHSLNGDSDELKLSRWAERLASLPSLALPTDYPRACTFTSISNSGLRAVINAGCLVVQLCASHMPYLNLEEHERTKISALC